MKKANKPVIRRSLLSKLPTICNIYRFAAIALVFLIAFSHNAPKAYAQSPDTLSGPEKVLNPYCKVSTYISSRFNGPARAMLRENGKPIIVINPDVIGKVGLVDFFMAHECCHHRLGHLKIKKKPIPSINGRALTKMNAKMEADADCCAAKLLTFQHNTRAIEKAKRFMSRFGRVPTGFGYPTGAARLGAIRACHRRAQKEFANKFVSKHQAKPDKEDW